MPRSARIPDRAEVTDDTPLHLATAAAIAFPDGCVSALALRNAAARGELEHMRIGGRILTKLRWIEEFTERCRQKPKAPGSGSSGATSGRMESADLAHGPSRTMEESDKALASVHHALESRLRQLKTPSPATSSRSEKSRARNTVVPMRSRSTT